MPGNRRSRAQGRGSCSVSRSEGVPAVSSTSRRTRASIRPVRGLLWAGGFGVCGKSDDVRRGVTWWSFLLNKILLGL